MRKTNLTLTDMLLEQAENLTDSTLTVEQLKLEIEKSKTLSGLAEQITAVQQAETNDLAVKVNAVKTAAEVGFLYNPEELHLKALPIENAKHGYMANGLEFEE